MNRDSKNSKRIRWDCGQGSCTHTNYRIIFRENVIFEDYCEACHKLTHEPITREVKDGRFCDKDADNKG